MDKTIISILVISFILISGCGEINTKNCPEDSCEVGLIKCEYLSGQKVTSSKVDEDYVEFNCIKDENNCGKWETDLKKCVFNDLRVRDLAINIYPPNGTNLSLVTDYSIYSSEDFIDSEITLYFYVNETDMDGNVINEVIEEIEITPRLKPLPSYYNREGSVYKYVDQGGDFGYIRIPYKVNKPGTYLFYILIESKDKIIEVEDYNNADYNVLYINFTGNIDIFNIYNKYKDEGIIKKNIFNKLKKIIYCDTSLSCKISESIKALSENDVDKILEYFVPNNSLFSQSSTELYSIIENPSLINLTFCDYDSQNRSSDYYYTDKLEHTYGVCDDYDILYSNRYSYYDWKYRDQINYGLPLMKINKDKITEEIAFKSALYYSEVTESFFYGGHYYQRGENKYINYTIFEEADNYIIHIFKTDSMEFDFDECYKLPIFYDVFKVNKEDKNLIRLNKGAVDKLFGNCDMKLPLSDKLRVCPDSWVFNAMPGATLNKDECKEEEGCFIVSREYLIVNHTRRELEEFDLGWIKRNCDVNIPSYVY